jgi:hypothetical protein
MISKGKNRINPEDMFTYQSRKHVKESNSAGIDIVKLKMEINEPRWEYTLVLAANSQTASQQDRSNKSETISMMCKALENNNV